MSSERLVTFWFCVSVIFLSMEKKMSYAQPLNGNGIVEYWEQCHADSDCKVGSFCQENNGHKYCEFCFDCPNLAFRETSRKTNCAKSWTECGPCLYGYEEELLTGGRVRKQCLPILEMNSQSSSSTSSDGHMPFPAETPWLIAILISIVGLVVLCFGGLWCYIDRKKENNNNPAIIAPENLNFEGASEEFPPRYEDIIQQNANPTLSDCDPLLENNSVRTHSVVTTSNVNDVKSDATPFNCVSYIEHLPNVTTPNGEQVVVGAVAIVERPTSPTESVHSNATEPSQWEPSNSLLVSPELSDLDEQEEEEIDLTHEENIADENGYCSIADGNSGIHRNNHSYRMSESTSLDERSLPYSSNIGSEDNLSRVSSIGSMGNLQTQVILPVRNSENITDENGCRSIADDDSGIHGNDLSYRMSESTSLDERSLPYSSNIDSEDNLSRVSSMGNLPTQVTLPVRNSDLNIDLNLTHHLGNNHIDDDAIAEKTSDEKKIVKVDKRKATENNEESRGLIKSSRFTEPDKNS